MGIASMVIGIVGVILSFVPYGSCISLVGAPIGLILGIVDVVAKNKTGEPKGMAIAGIILNAITIVILILLVVLAMIGMSLIY